MNRNFVKTVEIRRKIRENVFTMREIAVVFDPERKLFLYFGVALLAIGVGPFGTYEAMSFWQRTMFWTLDVLGGMVIIVPVLHVFFYSRLVAFIPSYPRFVLGVALGALPTTGYITVLYGTVGAALDISTPFSLLFVEVTVFSTVLLLTEYVLWPAVFGEAAPQGAVANPGPEPDAPPAAPKPQVVPLLTRLPLEHSDSEIVSISMQDHYAQVTTTEGTALILMRLSDAIDLLEGSPGARIHRSHWVATRFVEDIVRNGRRIEVLLKDGRQLPIGNTYLKAAQEQLGIAVPGKPS